MNIPSSIDVLPLDRDIDWERNRNDVTEVSQRTMAATGMAEECFPTGKRSYSAPDLSTGVANDSQKVFYHTLATAASKDDLAICKRDSAVTYQSLELESVCIPEVFYQTLIMNASSDELGMDKRGNSVYGVSRQLNDPGTGKVFYHTLANDDSETVLTVSTEGCLLPDLSRVLDATEYP